MLWSLLGWHMSFEIFMGFAHGASCHTWKLTFATWVIYNYIGQLVSSGGACLG